MLSFGTVPPRQLTPTERELLEINKLGRELFAANCESDPVVMAESVPCLLEMPAVRLRARGRTDGPALLRSLLHELREVLDAIRSGRIPSVGRELTAQRAAELVDGLYFRDTATSLSEARLALDPPDRADRVRRTEEPWLYRFILGELERRGELSEDEIGLVDDRPIIDLTQYPREVWARRKFEVYEELHFRIRAICTGLHNRLLVGEDRTTEAWRQDALHALFVRSAPLPAQEQSLEEDRLTLNEFTLAGSRHGAANSAYWRAQDQFRTTLRERALLDHAARESSFYAFAAFLEDREEGRLLIERWWKWLDSCRCGEVLDGDACVVHRAMFLYEAALTLLSVSSSDAEVAEAKEFVDRETDRSFDAVHQEEDDGTLNNARGASARGGEGR